MKRTSLFSIVISYQLYQLRTDMRQFPCYNQI